MQQKEKHQQLILKGKSFQRSCIKIGFDFLNQCNEFDRLDREAIDVGCFWIFEGQGSGKLVAGSSHRSEQMFPPLYIHDEELPPLLLHMELQTNALEQAIKTHLQTQKQIFPAPYTHKDSVHVFRIHWLSLHFLFSTLEFDMKVSEIKQNVFFDTEWTV